MKRASKYAEKQTSQERRDLAKYGTVWDCPMARVSAHSVRSRQAMAQLRADGC